MDLIKQFPDISMRVREKRRLRKKLYPQYDNSMPSYEKIKYLENYPNHGIKKWFGKLILMLLAGSLFIYLAIHSAIRFL